MVASAIGLVAGIWLDAAWAIPLWLGIGLFVLAGAATVGSRRKGLLAHIALAMAATAVGAVLHDLHFRRQPANHVSRYCAQGPVRVRLTGTVLAPPEIRVAAAGRIRWISELPRTRLLVESVELEGKSGPIPVCGTVSVHVREPVLHIAAGDRVEILGELYRPPPPDNPGQRDWPLILHRRGILAQVSCERAANIEVTHVESQWSRWISGVRRRLRASILDKTMPADVPGADLLAALVLGQRSRVDDDLNQAFVNTGTVHYLSVSGAHVGMLASVVWMTGTIIGASRRSCALWAMVLISGYAVLTEPQAPVVRSALMGDLLCVAILLRRPMRSVNWLALSAVILLLIQPTQLFDPGFQLSYITLLSVMFLGPRCHEVSARFIRQFRGRDDPLLSAAIQHRLNPPSPLRLLFNWFGAALGWSLAISVPAWLVGSILGAYHFQQVAAWGWLNTILITPLVWIVLVLGFVKTVVSTAVPSLSALFGVPLAWLTDRLVQVVEGLQRLPGSGTTIPSMPLWLTAVALAALGLWMIWPWVRLSSWWLTGIILVVLLSGLGHFWPPGHRDRLTLTFPRITNGSACVINLPNGRTWIYDFGSLAAYDIEKWVLGPLLTEQRVSQIDTVVISHPNLDHFSGLPDLIACHRVRRLLLSPYFGDFGKPGDAADRLTVWLENARAPIGEIQRGDTFANTGDVTVEVLWPPPPGQIVLNDANESSVVLRLSYGGHRIMLCGDIMEQAQGYLLRTRDVKADVLVLPHHGSTAHDPRPFILAVDPRYCIRTGGTRRPDIPDKLADILAGRVYLDTQADGAIEVNVQKSSLRVRPCRISRGDR